MIVAVTWREWLRNVDVIRFDTNSPVAVEDYLQAELPGDRAAFVFCDDHQPMSQSIAFYWVRFSARQLTEIYNAIVAKDRRVPKNFATKEAAYAALAMEIIRLGKSAVPYIIGTERKMSDDIMEDDVQVDEAQAQAESPAELKRQAAAQKRAEKEQEKLAKQAAKNEAAQRKAEEKAAAQAKRAPGVIATLMEVLQDGGKHTVDELYAHLADVFPDRGEGMKNTIKIQLLRLHQQGRLVVHSEERHDSEGKRLPGKIYWGEPVGA